MENCTQTDGFDTIHALSESINSVKRRLDRRSKSPGKANRDWYIAPMNRFSSPSQTLTNLQARRTRLSGLITNKGLGQSRARASQNNISNVSHELLITPTGTGSEGVGVEGLKESVDTNRYKGLNPRQKEIAIRKEKFAAFQAHRRMRMEVFS